MASLEFREKDFVHLHLHSDYSLLQSAIQLKPLAKRLGELEMKACAVTDYGNMFGAVSFYNTMKGAGVRPIIGYDAFLATGSRHAHDSAAHGSDKPYYSLVLLAKNYKGYQNLVQISSKAFTEGYHVKPRIDRELLAEFSEGLIALSGGFAGGVMHHLRYGDESAAAKFAGEMSEIFGPGNFYLEIQDRHDEDERKVRPMLVELSKKLSLPLVATNDPHYLTEADARAHEILLCIGEGRMYSETRHVYLTPEYYVRSAEEMWSLFGKEIPESLTNTLKIAEECEFDLKGGGDLTLPTFPIPPEYGDISSDAYFEKVVWQGFEKRKETVFDPMVEAGTLRYPLDDYRARLQTEIDIIKGMGFPGYFLIVWEFIKYAVDNKIPVGVGRGSAAGSLAAYCLEITGIDPIQYDLLFERFLNPERISMPDIDIDFCIRGRGNVIEHVTEVYGRESVCQIVTFGTMASKAAIKDVGRALNIPFGDVERIAKLIPPPFRGRNTSISQAIERVPELVTAMKADPRIQDLVDTALRIEGCSRHTSVHAAGVVISPKPLHEIVPVAISAKSELTSQYPMGDLEKVGMLKMDFLGLTTLTIIEDCLVSLREKAGVEIDWTLVSLNDEKTMKLFSDGKTDAVFQFESSGMQDICRQMGPKELEDLSALNALYRPGPLDGGMIPDFIARFRGEKKVKYLVPEMEETLKNTYGVLVYQEQIMQLAQRLAGYSLGEADLMRRAMGKKKVEEMLPHEKKFIEGAVERNISRDKAKEIFDLMAKFADYGFNRSHSMAYAYLAFQTGYLKAHYPTYFYASVLSHESDDAAKIYKYSTELRSMGMRLLPPDVNESDEGFTPTDDSVRFGLSAIKGIGTSTVRAIVEARSAGKFKSLFDFASRIDPGSINRRALESLITAGAFDSVIPPDVSSNQWRANLYAAVESAMSLSQRSWNDRERGQTDLFGGGDTVDIGGQELPDVKPWTQAEMSQHEKAAIGFFLSVHPLDAHLDTIENLGIKFLSERGDIHPNDRLKMVGVVSGLQVRYSKKGNRFATFRFEDKSVGVKCLVWAEAYGRLSSMLADDALLIIEGRVEAVDGQEITLIVEDAKDLEDAKPRNARSIVVSIPSDASEDLMNELYTTLSTAQGRCEVVLKMPVGKQIEVTLESQILRVEGSARLEKQLVIKGCAVEWVM
ncbi:MAG TPA: DNA polymerase III subunit alpha [Pyrinomonadaceae bacterium]|nr:DNA polymerase III subunit alpha [Pyrinomonadaceae bacterium]